MLTSHLNARAQFNEHKEAFRRQEYRRTWNNNEWWFVLEDIVYILTDSSDPKQYLQKMNCLNAEGAFRIIQSIPSKKAEPFKRWLAKVGYERVQEIEEPELGKKRMKDIYKLKGYSDDWIEKRVRGIAIRDELTDEWGKRSGEKVVSKENYLEAPEKTRRIEYKKRFIE